MARARAAGTPAASLWRMAALGGPIPRILAAARWLGLAALAIGLALVATIAIVRPPSAHIAPLALDLAIASVAALALEQVALRIASTARIGSVRVRLAIPPLLTASVIAVTVVSLAQAMFISPEDSVLLLVFLGFALLVALALAGYLAGNIAHSIARVETGARRIAAGDYAFRIADGDIAGYDELARLARWFNAMAANVEQAFTRRDRAEADRRQMLAALSHDLRTPLTSIRAMIESIDDGVTTDEATVRRYHRAIRAETRRLGTLLDDLFELSRLESGTLALARERLGIDDLVSDALEAFRGQAERRHVRLFGRVEDDLPPVEGDARQIARVLGNLVQNALRYTPAGGATFVGAGRGRDAMGASFVEVWVADSGPGIGASDLVRIFETAYRGDSSRTRIQESADNSGESGGAGLGLAIARGVVELHGGRIWAESPVPPHLRAHLPPLVADPDAPFRGTALCFTLPLSA